MIEPNRITRVVIKDGRGRVYKSRDIVEASDPHDFDFLVEHVVTKFERSIQMLPYLTVEVFDATHLCSED